MLDFLNNIEVKYYLALFGGGLSIKCIKTPFKVDWYAFQKVSLNNLTFLANVKKLPNSRGRFVYMFIYLVSNGKKSYE